MKSKAREKLFTFIIRNKLSKIYDESCKRNKHEWETCNLSKLLSPFVFSERFWSTSLPSNETWESEVFRFAVQHRR